MGASGSSHSSARESPATSKLSAPNTEGDGVPRATSSRGSTVSQSLKELTDEPLREVGRVSPSPSITDEQKTMVSECLATIETGLAYAGVHLNADKILPFVETITRRDDTIVEGEALLKTNGIYIVYDGVLDMCAADGETVTQRLEAGEFFGEISVLFRVPSNRGVNVVSRYIRIASM